MTPADPGPGSVASPCTFAADDADALCRRFMAEVVERGTRRTFEGEAIREVWGVSGRLQDPRARLLTSRAHPRMFNPGLAIARWLYLFSGSDRLADITAYSPGAARFTDDGVTMPGGSHGARAFAPASGIDQVEQVVAAIDELGETTRGVIALHHPTDLAHGTRDYVCVNSVLLTPRDGRLHAMVHMRSNEALHLLWYDLVEFTMLQEYVAARLGLELGAYLHGAFVLQITGDQHLSVAAAVAEEHATSVPMSRMPPMTRADRAHVVEHERLLRESAVHAGDDAFLGRVRALADDTAPYWADLLTAAAMQARFVAGGGRTVASRFEGLGGPVTAACVAYSRGLSGT